MKFRSSHVWSFYTGTFGIFASFHTVLDARVRCLRCLLSTSSILATLSSHVSVILVQSIIVPPVRRQTKGRRRFMSLCLSSIKADGTLPLPPRRRPWLRSPPTVFIILTASLIPSGPHLVITHLLPCYCYCCYHLQCYYTVPVAPLATTSSPSSRPTAR